MTFPEYRMNNVQSDDARVYELGKLNQICTSYERLLGFSLQGVRTRCTINGRVDLAQNWL